MSVKQVVVVSRTEPRNGQGLEPTAFFDEDGNPVDFGGGESGPVAWDDVTGKPASFTPAAHNQAATTVTVAASTGIVGANAQLVLADLAARVVALEALGE